MQSLSSLSRQSKAEKSLSLWETLLSRLSRVRFNTPFLIRLRHWEYWPFAVVYFPVFFYYLWLAIKARSPFFFSASNPSIKTGGLLGESKADIMARISDEFKPQTWLLSASATVADVLALVAENKISYPLIAKPDVGERGWRVEKIADQSSLIAYLNSSPGDFLIQEYVDEPLELGVFYYRLPGQLQGVVSSIVQKEFLSIRGNGVNCIEELIMQNERAILQLPTLTAKYGHLFHNVPAPGEVITLVPIGNHSKGTKFLNANHLICPELNRLFDQISQPIEGFYFGRYDLRCRSVADLYAGKHIRILELNGAGAEPAHIYHPGFSLWEAYRVLFHHWRVLYDISRENHRRGVAYMTLREALRIWRGISKRQ
jgi:hypothetical protein